MQYPFITLIPTNNYMQDKSVDYFSHGYPKTHSPAQLQQVKDLQLMEPAPLKHFFLNMLTTLDLEERFVLTRVEAPEVSRLVRENAVGKWAEGRGRAKEQVAWKGSHQDASQGIATRGHHQDKEGCKGLSLTESLVFVSEGRQYLESICFQHCFLEAPEKLADLLLGNIKDSTALPMLKALKSPLRPQSIAAELQKCRTRCEFDVCLLHFMRDQVLLRLREGVMDSQFYSRQLEEERRVKREFNNYWRSLPEDHKRRLLLLDCKDTESLMYHLGQAKQELSVQQLDQEINMLLKLNKNDFCNRIFKCRMRNIGQSMVEYHRAIYSLWKKQTYQTVRRKKMLRPTREDRDYNSEHKFGGRRNSDELYRKKGKTRKNSSLESNQTNETEEQQRDISVKSPEKKMMQYEKEVKPQCHHHFMERSEEKRQMFCSVEREEKSIKGGKIKCRPESRMNENDSEREDEGNPQKLRQEPSKQSVSSKATFSSKNSGSTSTPVKLKPRHSKQDIHEATLNKLEDQLCDMSDMVSEEANQYYERRIVAFERIQFLLQFYSIPIKLFGSCANGIAVKNSDIDIAIDRSILAWMGSIPQGQKIRVALEKVQEILEQHNCIVEIRLIKTAAVPVMKLTIDTSLTFISQDFAALNRPHNSGPIQADITIETSSIENQSSHLGILTTGAISQWLTHLKPLHTIVIIMKEFFTINQLNLAYEGGLNTISMIVMLVAYIIDKGLDQQENSAMVLEKILRFYVEEFDEKTFGIDLLSRNGIYYRKDEYLDDSPKVMMRADLEIRDPICQGRNMTRNCYHYPDIKKMFLTILEKCFSQGQMDLEELIEKGEDKDLGALGGHFFAERNVFLDLHKAMEGRI